MRPVTQRLSAAGFAPWIPLNRLQRNTNVGLAVSLSSGASLTYTVEHTLDDLYKEYTDFTISRTTTTATVTQTTHGLSVGDWVYIKNAGAPMDGFYKVASVVDANNFTYTVLNSGVASSGPNASMQKARVFAHAVLAALTASNVSNYIVPVTATRLTITAYSSGFADYTVLQGN